MLIWEDEAVDAEPRALTLHEVMDMYDRMPRWQRKRERAGFSPDVVIPDPHYTDEVLPTRARNRVRRACR